MVQQKPIQEILSEANKPKLCGEVAFEHGFRTYNQFVDFVVNNFPKLHLELNNNGWDSEHKGLIPPKLVHIIEKHLGKPRFKRGNKEYIANIYGFSTWRLFIRHMKLENYNLFRTITDTGYSDIRKGLLPMHIEMIVNVYGPATGIENLLLFKHKIDKKHENVFSKH